LAADLAARFAASEVLFCFREAPVIRGGWICEIRGSRRVTRAWGLIVFLNRIVGDAARGFAAKAALDERQAVPISKVPTSNIRE
jgi:hypothetical protein